jgi:hypothetical protein
MVSGMDEPGHFRARRIEYVMRRGADSVFRDEGGNEYLLEETGADIFERGPASVPEGGLVNGCVVCELIAKAKVDPCLGVRFALVVGIALGEGKRSGIQLCCAQCEAELPVLMRLFRDGWLSDHAVGAFDSSGNPR